jgi:hypothetical protein
MVCGSPTYVVGVWTADYNDVKEEIKFENQNSIPHCLAPFILLIFYISAYDFPIS